MNKDAKIIGIWGGRGSGKSTRVKELLKDRDRVIVFDPLDEYGKEGFVERKSLSEVYKYIKLRWAGGFKVSLNVSHDPDQAEKLLQLSQDMLTIQRPYYDGVDDRKITLVVEEMSLSVRNQAVSPEKTQFLRLCNLGRHYGVEIIGASQRLAQVHTDFRDNCAEHYFFRMGDHTGQKAVGQIIGPGNADKVAVFKPHQYLHFEGGEVFEGKNSTKF